MKPRRVFTFVIIGCYLMMLPASVTNGAGHEEVTPSPLPDGWRRPRLEETSQSWRSDSPSHYLSVKGDFTGDGKVDTATILIRTDGSGFAPFLLITGGDNTRRFFQGEETNPISFLPDEGIKILRPGKYLTVCGKGYDCPPSASRSVTISTDAVEFFKYEGPARMIYWNKSKGALSEVWLSD